MAPKILLKFLSTIIYMKSLFIAILPLSVVIFMCQVRATHFVYLRDRKLGFLWL